MTRTVKEWIGKTPDTPPPKSCKRRIIARQGERCAACGLQFMGPVKPEFDHIIALTLYGENRESNLQALCGGCHKTKTKGDVKAKAKVARLQDKRFGLSGPRQKIQSRGFGKAEPQRKATRPLKKPLPPRRVE